MATIVRQSPVILIRRSYSSSNGGSRSIIPWQNYQRSEMEEGNSQMAGLIVEATVTTKPIRNKDALSNIWRLLITKQEAFADDVCCTR